MIKLKYLVISYLQLFPIPGLGILPSAWGKTGHLKMCPEFPQKIVWSDPYWRKFWKFTLLWKQPDFINENYQKSTAYDPSNLQPYSYNNLENIWQGL